MFKYLLGTVCRILSELLHCIRTLKRFSWEINYVNNAICACIYSCISISPISMYTNILILFCQSRMCYAGDGELFKRNARHVFNVASKFSCKPKKKRINTSLYFTNNLLSDRLRCSNFSLFLLKFDSEYVCGKQI